MQDTIIDEIRQSIEVETENNCMFTVFEIMKYIEKKDRYIAIHQQRTADLAFAIAKEMNFNKQAIIRVFLSALIHDIGKILVPDSILQKKGKLTDGEFIEIKKHPGIGSGLLDHVLGNAQISEIVLQHHERMDGSGYPRGLKKHEISDEAKVLMVADVVEAMTFERPYRKALGLETAIAEINNNMKTLYDADVANALMLITKKGMEISFWKTQVKTKDNWRRVNGPGETGRPFENAV